jgi:CubicO group peptidase (beta-lactamase class C family)
MNLGNRQTPIDLNFFRILHLFCENLEFHRVVFQETKAIEPMPSSHVFGHHHAKTCVFLLAFLVFGVVAQNLAAEDLRIQQSPPLRESIQEFVDRQELAGAVMLVANREKVLALESNGWADHARKKPMQTDSVFWIDSQSKPITAAALMILVDEGKVSLDDPVEKFLPGFRGQMVLAEKDNDHILFRKPKHPITVRNILAHTSGLPSGLSESYRLEFSVCQSHFGHGGAYSTTTSADTKNGLILVWLVQHAGFPGKRGQNPGSVSQKSN